MMTVSNNSAHGSTRRRFLRNASALAAASFLGVQRAAAAEPPPETKRIRLIATEDVCFAPQFLSAELLRLEGFVEVEYVRMNYEEYTNTGSAVAAGKAGITQDAGISFVTGMMPGNRWSSFPAFTSGAGSCSAARACAQSAISRASAYPSPQPGQRSTC